MIPSPAAIQRELDQHPDICLGRQDVAIRRIQDREKIKSSRRNAMIDVAREGGGSPVEMNERLVKLVCFDLLQGGDAFAGFKRGEP